MSILLHVRPGEENERGPLYMESVVAALHSLDTKQGSVGLELGMAQGKVGFYIRTTPAASELIESQLYAQYPDIDIERVQGDPFAVSQA